MGFQERKQARIEAQQLNGTTKLLIPNGCEASGMYLEFRLGAQPKDEEVITWLEPVSHAFCAMIEQNVPVKPKKFNNPDRASVTCLNKNCPHHT